MKSPEVGSLNKKHVKGRGAEEGLQSTVVGNWVAMEITLEAIPVALLDRVFPIVQEAGLTAVMEICIRDARDQRDEKRGGCLFVMI